MLDFFKKIDNFQYALIFLILTGCHDGSLSVNRKVPIKNIDGYCQILDVHDLKNQYDCLIKSSSLGNPVDQYNLSIFYENIDKSKSIFWLEKSALQNYERAQHNLGIKYLEGDGITKDIIMAEKWARIAIDNGFVYSYNTLGLISLENGKFHHANKMFLIAANAGSLAAKYNLGMRYQYGEGVVQNMEKAIQIYQETAKEGYVLSYVNLGIMYSKGWGTTKNKALAKKYLNIAARDGNKTAQFYLGRAIIYKEIDGTTEDGIGLLQQALIQGCQPALPILLKVKTTDNLNFDIPESKQNDESCGFYKGFIP